ncbi:MAG: glycosyl hydrolase [Alistipes sp.]|nr:glycosyl hydrolase [Alistipes sp.]
MKTKTTYTLLLLLVGCFIGQGVTLSAQGDKALKEAFKNPGLAYRMNVNRHHVPTTDSAQNALIQEVLSNGYGGMATNVNAHEYLRNEEEWKLFNRFIHAARAKGLDLWLYDEKSYPSGMADTYVLDEHPQWEAEGLLFRDTVCGPRTTVEIPSLPGSRILTMAVPFVGDSIHYHQAQDLSLYEKEGKLHWTSPEGSWHVVQITHAPLYEGFQSGTERGGEIPRYPSLLMPEVTTRFIDFTHKQYAAHFKEKLGDLFTSTFTDEPSSMALPFPNLGYGVYPWKENVSQAFQQRYVTPLKDVLLPMMLDRGAVGSRLRYQYFQIIADFMSQHYFRQLRDYCASQKLRSGGHLLLEESIMAHVPLYGSIMACYREMDIPGIDVLTGMPSLTRRYLYSSRLASSAAELEGRSMVMTESCPISDYNTYNGKEAPSIEIRGSLNRQMVGGVTDFNNYLQLQHEDSNGRKVFNTYIARVAMMLSEGTRAARIAVYYPIETMWAKYRPLPTGLQSWDNVAGGAPEAQHLAGLFEQVSDCLYDNGWEFCYVDGPSIEQARIENKSMGRGTLKWDLLILPGVEVLSPNALNRISEFVRAGGKVIFLETLPCNSQNAFPSPIVTEKVQELLQSGSQAAYYEKSWKPRMFNLLLEGLMDREILLNSYDGILISHKRVGGKQLFFLINDTNAPKAVQVTLPGVKEAECWNPINGEVTPFTAAPLSLEPYAGIILRQTK